ncbi:MAG: hypothetical protein CVU88_04615 [Firmicutes bacterium HGW-Firmicutes-13]|nr:MAG: hypothetical protein CVU88_04615 [Firmicutes bacterium HGW-Firmicutes-13]
MGGGMKNREKLMAEIEKLREILHSKKINLNSAYNKKSILKISQKLDQLISEYYNLNSDD